ncbi:hypothetical protein TELCIR_14594 [Teladorsagia circumcincta]|uniref:Methyltransferase FkbM domain-containing protein n=1 Tax=Teladorsagia circumcincta TaxID=45464 RepID=A0A2G9U0M2_TELCI|nr:hypothetical protein TELCIR_14594 [Teladorsagia circumcincta]
MQQNEESYKDSLSPNLFTTCLEYAIRRCDWRSFGVNIDCARFDHLRFAFLRDATSPKRRKKSLWLHNQHLKDKSDAEFILRHNLVISKETPLTTSKNTIPWKSIEHAIHRGAWSDLRVGSGSGIPRPPTSDVSNIGSSHKGVAGVHRLATLHDCPLWEEFAEMTKYCTSNTDVSKIKLIELPNDDEVKHYILSQDATDPSVVVSLGIGADIKVEQQLKELLPEVNEYKYMPVVHIDIGTFFTKMVNRTHIDHMILDNEGPEYQLIPMIAIDNVFAEENIAICHMNVEFHAPGPKTRYEEFVEVMKGVLRVGRFAAIHNENFGHQRMFLVNYEDPYCVSKYLEQFF